MDLLAPHMRELHLECGTLLDASSFHFIAKFKRLKIIDVNVRLDELQAHEAALAGLSGLCSLELLQLMMRRDTST